MLSKLSIRTLSLLRFPNYRFCQKQEGEEILIERKIEADSSNPQLENRDKAFSYFRLLSRLFWWSASGLFFYNLYLNMYTADPSKELGYQPHVNQAVKYCQTQYQNFYNFMTKPPLEKLLPDLPELPPGYEIPKTLVLNLTGTLIHMDYVFGVGAEFKRRNGLTRFLEKLPKNYEVIILSDDDSMFAQTMAAKLDPGRQIFAGCFGRESLVFERGRYIRDLKYLNRPLNRVVVVDSDPDRNTLQQENTIFLKPFDGLNSDNALNDLGVFLEHLGKPQIKDVRTELSKFGNFDPQTKYMEEVKAREITIKNNMNRGIFGLINKPKNVQFEQHQKRQ